MTSAFALLRRDEGTESLLGDIYTFNGAGTGGLHSGQQLDAVVTRFSNLLSGLKARGAASMQDIARANGRVLQILDELRRISGFDNTFLDGVPPTGAFGTLAYELSAVLASAYTIPSSNVPLPFGDVSTIPLKRTFAPTTPFKQLTEIYGADGGEADSSLVDGRFSFVSFSGQHYSAPENSFGVYIEDQPLTRGTKSLQPRPGGILSLADRSY